MKKIFNLLPFTLLFLFIVSCTNFSSPKGSVSVNLPGQASARAVGEVYSKDKTACYEINLSGNSYADAKSGKPGENIVFEELEPGDYSLLIYAYDESEDTIAIGTATVTVNAGETSNAPVSMLPFYEGTLEKKGATISAFEVKYNGDYLVYPDYLNNFSLEDFSATVKYSDGTFAEFSNLEKIDCEGKALLVVPPKEKENFYVGNVPFALTYCSVSENQEPEIICEAKVTVPVKYNSETSLFEINLTKTEIPEVFGSSELSVVSFPGPQPVVYGTDETVGDDFFYSVISPSASDDYEIETKENKVSVTALVVKDRKEKELTFTVQTELKQSEYAVPLPEDQLKTSSTYSVKIIPYTISIIDYNDQNKEITGALGLKTYSVTILNSADPDMGTTKDFEWGTTFNENSVVFSGSSLLDKPYLCSLKINEIPENPKGTISCVITMDGYDGELSIFKELTIGSESEPATDPDPEPEPEFTLIAGRNPDSDILKTLNSQLFCSAGSTLSIDDFVLYKVYENDETVEITGMEKANYLVTYPADFDSSDSNLGGSIPLVIENGSDDTINTELTVIYKINAAAPGIAFKSVGNDAIVINLLMATQTYRIYGVTGDIQANFIKVWADLTNKNDSTITLASPEHPISQNGEYNIDISGCQAGEYNCVFNTVSSNYDYQDFFFQDSVASAPVSITVGSSTPGNTDEEYNLVAERNPDSTTLKDNSGQLYCYAGNALSLNDFILYKELDGGAKEEITGAELNYYQIEYPDGFSVSNGGSNVPILIRHNSDTEKRAALPVTFKIKQTPPTISDVTVAGNTISFNLQPSDTTYRIFEVDEDVKTTKHSCYAILTLKADTNVVFYSDVIESCQEGTNSLTIDTYNVDPGEYTFVLFVSSTNTTFEELFVGDPAEAEGEITISN